MKIAARLRSVFLVLRDLSKKLLKAPTPGYLAIFVLVFGIANQAGDAHSLASTSVVQRSAPIRLEEPLENDVVNVDGRTPAAILWKEEIRSCAVRGQRHYCDGPRIAPLASFEDAKLRDELGLGTIKTFARARTEPMLAAIQEATPPRESLGLSWPVDGGYFGRGFGRTRRAELKRVLHRGIDIPAAGGSTIRAVEAGLVIYSDNGAHGYGNIIAIAHERGTMSVYAHNRANYVAAGEKVGRGQPIGEVGQTGLARGNHLHFEWFDGGRRINPEALLVGRPSKEEENALRRAQSRRKKRMQAKLAERRARAARRAI